MWKPQIFRRRPSSKRTPKSRARRLSAERLEDRSMFSASFGSALSIGGPASDGVFDIAADNAGNSYVTGYFSGTADFDMSQAHLGDADILTARGRNDAFVAKYAPDDSLVWVRRMGGDYSGGSAITDVGRSITLDAAGNVYVTGQFHESADFGSTTLVSAGSTDGFIAKFDADGTMQWATRFGSTSWDAGHGIGVDARGNVYVVADRVQSYEILKFGPTGATAWTASISNTLTGKPDITVSSKGNVYVVGTFQGTADFDPGPKVKSVSSGPGYAAFVVNLDTNGKFKWVTPFIGRTIGSTWGSAFANSVTLDDSGQVYVGGHYHGTVDFNPGSAVTSLDPAGGAFIAKLNSTGGLTWARAFVSSLQSHVYSIDTDALGNVYATGSFTSSIDLDPGAGIHANTSNGGADIFVVKLTAAGNYVWGETFGGTSLDVGFGIAVDDGGIVHLAGYYADLADFDPDPLGEHFLGAAGASRDGFRLRLLQA